MYTRNNPSAMTAKPPHRRPLHWPRRQRYPVWNARTIAIAGAVVVTLSAVTVFVLGRRPVIVEMLLTLGAVAAGLFMLLAVGLYRGVRVKRADPVAPSLKQVELRDVLDRLDFSTPDASCPLDVGDCDGDGCLGAIVGLLLSVVILIALVGLLWLLVNVAVGVFFVLTLALSWVTHLALRQVFVRSRQCRGRLGPSIGYAVLYTFMYTGWLLALILAADYFV